MGFTEKPPCEAAEPFSKYEEAWKAPWGGIERRPEPLLEREARSFCGGGARGGAAAEEGSQLSKFRKLSLTLHGEK